MNKDFPQTAEQTSAAHLAYLGDCVYEMLVREYLIKTGCSKPSISSLSYVTASAQSSALEKILPLLTEGEEDAYRRGRNCVHGNAPKNSSVSEYRRATGLEALFGYLYVRGESERIRELFVAAFSE
ncbi:MAG: ribonuclease III [Ruminococcaceae bacterium]|nr:ribonuclease III [Oscillospiraceae bacterium]